MPPLTERQAFKTMIMFLERWCYETQSGDLGPLLTELQFLEDGGPADPAAWQDWIKCINKVLELGDADEFFALRLFRDEEAGQRFDEERYAWYRQWNPHWPEKLDDEAD